MIYPDCRFAAGDILDFDLYDSFKPDIFIMAEVTWYVLEKLNVFTAYLKSEFKDAYLIHLLTTYPEGGQKYGVDYFTDHAGILKYFKGFNYIETGEIRSCKDMHTRNLFLAEIP